MDKGELKAAVVHEVGVKVDDMLESAKAESAKHTGANVALLAAAKKVAELAQHVDKDLEEGKLNDLEPHLVAQAVKKYITRCEGVLHNLAEVSARAKLTSEGRIQMAELIVGNLKKVHDAELAKSRLKKQLEEEPAVAQTDVRPTGVRPMSLKEQRLAEEASNKSNGSAKKTAKKTAKKASRKMSGKSTQKAN